MSNLVPFQFRGDSLDAVSRDGFHGVTLASLCAPFGLDPEWQRQKLVSAEWATTLKLKAVAEDGKIREVVCLDLRSINGWLFTLQTKTLSPALREKLLAYQRECADVLADHFLGRRGAPEANVLDSAETFAQQTMRVADDPRERARLELAIRRVMRATSRKWANVEGIVRRAAGSPGWLRIALFNVPRIIALLESVETGVVQLPPRQVLRAKSPQTELFQ